MAKFLQKALDASEPLFSSGLAQLERAAGFSGVDIRLIADMLHKGHAVMRSLGLDPADTTAQEFYSALNSYIERQDEFDLLYDTDFVIIRVDEQIFSLNLIDVIENAHHNLPLEDRHFGHARRALRGELVDRYLAHARTDNVTVQQIAQGAELIFESDSWYDSHKNFKAQVESGRKDESMKPSILAIGDIFTDAFITLGDETAKVIKEGDTEWLAVPFGRKPPYQKVDIVKSVGPSPNVAVSIARLGMNASLMAWVGGDDTGEEALEYLKTQNVDTTPMVIESDKATSYWYVLCYKADRTMLVKSEKYRYEWRDPQTKPDWIYLAYLGEDSWELHEGLLDYLQRNPEIKFAFQPGTFQFEWGKERLAGLYSRSNIVLMNREEAMDVTGRPYDSVRYLAEGLHELGPEIVVITDGPNGSYVSNDGRVLSIPNYPDMQPPLERTGAGDAFSSTFVAAIADGESVETALAWSPINSMNVVQHVGAQAGLLSKDDILKYLSEAPEWYKVSEVDE